jgi:hypothetical protein
MEYLVQDGQEFRFIQPVEMDPHCKGKEDH